MATTMERGLGEILDSEWVRSQFYSPVTSDESEEHRIRTLRYQTTSNTSVGGSGLGNSRVLNPPPGINQFADTPRGFAADGAKNGGNGVYHHEMLEKPMDIVHFRPGVPRFNPLASFWTSAFSPDAMEAVEYGWIRKAVSFVGNLLGYIVTAPFIVAGTIYKTMRSLIMGPNANKYSYYYLSPAPLLFWKGLDDMVNLMAIKMGFTGNARYTDEEIKADGTLPSGVNANMTDIMGMMPGIFHELSGTGGYRVDTITIGHRYYMMEQLKSDYLSKKSIAIFGTTFTSEKEYFNAMADWEVALAAEPDAYLNGKSVLGMLNEARDVIKGLNTLQSSQERYESIMGGTEWKGGTQTRKSNLKFNIDEDGKSSSTANVDEQVKLGFKAPEGGTEYGIGSTTDFQEIYKSVAIGGLDFFSLAVDKIESGSISMSNSVGPSNIESLFNGTVSTAKNAWFSASNGNIGDGVISDTVEAVAGGGKAFLNGLANGITGGVQSALFGGKAAIDIPDVYQSSSSTMPSMSYSFTSQAISGHPISKLKMLMPVMAILRCGTALSGGPRAFMSPYLVAVTHKGRNVCKMGMITSIKLDWGGEAGWDVNDIPCELKCDFEVTALDKNMHIPIDSTLTDIYNDESQWDAFTDVLAGVSPTDLDRSWSYNIKTNWARSVSKVDRFFSSSYMAVSLGAGTRNMFEGVISMSGGYIKR